MTVSIFFHKFIFYQSILKELSIITTPSNPETTTIERAFSLTLKNFIEGGFTQDVLYAILSQLNKGFVSHYLVKLILEKNSNYFR